MSSYKDDETTKEVDLKELESIDQKKELEEEIEENNETEENTEDVEESNDDTSNEEDLKDDKLKEETNTEKENDKKIDTKKDSKKDKKTLYIIVGLSAIILILIIVLLIVLIPKNKESKNKNVSSTEDKVSESEFVKTISNAIKNEKLVKEINKALNDSNVKTNKVYLLSMDIDRDNKQELMAYAEDENKKFLLQFEITDEVVYEDSFQLDSKDSMGYTYSVETDRNYFFTLHNGNYTIIERQKKIIKEEDYIKNYFTIANTYNKIPILNNAVEYDLSENFDAKELEKKEINEETLLKDNDIKETDIRPAAEKYFKDKKEAEEKAKKEEEERKIKEEEAKKKEEESTFKLEGKTLHYGKYTAETAVMFESIIINKDKTAKVDDKECSWKIGTFDFSQDSSKNEDNKKESITITCEEGDYNLTAFENDKLSNGGMLEFVFEK